MAGKVSIIDGYAGDPEYSTVPSGIVESFRYISAGRYAMVLKEPWYALLFADVVSDIPAGLSPQYVACQMLGNDVGTSIHPEINFVFHVAGTPTNLPTGANFKFMLYLKASSA